MQTLPTAIPLIPFGDDSHSCQSSPVSTDDTALEMHLQTQLHGASYSIRFPQFIVSGRNQNLPSVCTCACVNICDSDVI